MKTLTNKIGNIPYIALTVAALLGLAAAQAQAQSVTYNFSDGTGDGWSLGGFSSGSNPTISTIGGINYMFVPLGGFQVANVTTGNANTLNTAFNAAMTAAAANPSGYDISYNWYVNTAGFSGATFLQLGTFVNSSSGYYAQDYGADEAQLNGTQLSSGQVFTGTVTINMAAVGYSIPTADNFFRLGLIENGSGTGVQVGFSNISVVSVPEPASLSLLGLGVAAGAAFLRRRKA